MELGLQQKQKLSLVMTTELSQAIALLQYSTADLYDYIKNQELENPLLKLVEKEDSFFNQNKYSINNDTKDYWTNPIDYIATQEEVPERQKLLNMVRWMNINEEESELLYYLILNLDENGYLPLEVSEISSTLDIDEKFVRKIIEKLQRLDPIGIGAQNLSECLILQLHHYYPKEIITREIVRNHLEKLAYKKWDDIAKQMDVTLSEVKEANDIVRSLNPKPCNLGTETTLYLNPDIIIEKRMEQFNVRLNDEILPSIQFNHLYSDTTDTNSNLHNFVKHQYKNYQFLKNSIAQRKRTILKIVYKIIEKQSDFFYEGFSALQPLTLKEIANETGLHESTVSRATANKILQTPHGIFELRLLFTSKLNSENGSFTSQTKVKLLLEEFVNNENVYKPYSDQKIADYLKKEKGINISRRTVAKYREELNIPSSNKRKEIKIS